MGQADYRRVVEQMRLTDGTLLPIPVTLPVPASAELTIGQPVALRSPNNDLLAILLVEEIFSWDLEHEAQAVYGTTDVRHPLVAEMHSWGQNYVSGPLQVIALPQHYDYTEIRYEPAQVRARLEAMGYENVVAFQTRNPLHRAHEELTKPPRRSAGPC